MTMVERVAEAIKAANGGEFTSDNQALLMARSAIEAMRKPTEAMTILGLAALVLEISNIQGPLEKVKDGQELTDQQAADRYMKLGAIARSGREVHACFTAMIDKALDEEPAP